MPKFESPACDNGPMCTSYYAVKKFLKVCKKGGFNLERQQISAFKVTKIHFCIRKITKIGLEIKFLKKLQLLEQVRFIN